MIHGVKNKVRCFRINLLLMLWFLPILTWAAHEEWAWQQAVQDCDDQLASLKGNQLWSCPGLSLVKSCGNKSCEISQGENVTNCPADCLPNVLVRSYNNIILCDHYHEIQIPYSVAELYDLVRMAVSRHLKVKAIGRSHSATNILCSEGIVIPTEHLNKIIGIEKLNGELVVHTETGVTVFELSEWLHRHGYALNGLPQMGFRDVSVGGAMATSSHGSTPKHHGVLSYIVQSIEFIDGKGEVHLLQNNATKNKNVSDDFLALRTNLGMLGIITRVKLKIQPQFNLDVSVTYHSDSDFTKIPPYQIVQDCDYGQLNWFPGVGKYMRTCGKRTLQSANFGANNELLSPNIPPFVKNPFKQVLQMGACDNDIMCLMEKIRWWQFKLQPPFVVTTKKNNKLEKKYLHHLIGPSHRMVSSFLTGQQEGFFQMDWEFAIAQSDIFSAMQAIKKLTQDQKICLPLIGVFIRFAPIEEESLLAYSGGNFQENNGPWQRGQVATFLEMPVYLPTGFSPEQFKKYEASFVQFAQILVEQFHARPHWGKNRQWVFDKILQNSAYGSRLKRFQAVINKYDPNGTFANDFAERLGFTFSENFQH